MTAHDVAREEGARLGFLATPLVILWAVLGERGTDALVDWLDSLFPVP